MNKIKINGITCYIKDNYLSVGGHEWVIKSVNPMELNKPLLACTPDEVDKKVDELKFTLSPFDNGLLIITDDGKHQCKYHTVKCDGCDEAVYLPHQMKANHVHGRKITVCGDCKDSVVKVSTEHGVISKKVTQHTITKVRIAIDEAVMIGERNIPRTRLIFSKDKGWLNSNHSGNTAGMTRVPRILMELIKIYKIDDLSPTGLFLGLVEHYIETGEDLLAKLRVDITAEMYVRASMQVQLSEVPEEVELIDE